MSRRNAIAYYLPTPATVIHYFAFTIYNFTMGTFHIECTVENIINRNKSAVIPQMLVDTGSEYTWISAKTLERLNIEREKKDLTFVMANGQRISRSVGFAILRFNEYFTVDEVVFAEAGDLLLLGARTLEGLSLTVDSRQKKLVASGPILAAVNTASLFIKK